MDASLTRAAAKGREATERREQERRKALIVLMLRHLLDHGYVESCQRLSAEANVFLSKVDVADNVDLLRIVQEYEQAQEVQFGKRPKLVKKISSDEVPSFAGGTSRQMSKLPSLNQHSQDTTFCSAGNLLTPFSGQLAAKQRREQAAAATAAALAPTHGSSSVHAMNSQQSQQQRPTLDAVGSSSSSSSSSNNGSRNGGRAMQQAGKHSSRNSQQPAADGAAEECSEFQINGLGCQASSHAHVPGVTAVKPGSTGNKHPGKGGAVSSSGDGGEEEDSASDDFHENRLLRPLPTSLLGELRELGAAISRDIYLDSPNVRWADIAGLDEAKRLLKESVVLPLKYPHLFTGLLAPWRGLLLYGPPGTGKTLLARAVATQCHTTFFNISASSIISKWRGDSEKLVRILFELARHHAPSTIFLDEIDALMGARGAEGEHEASRRMKTELLIQMDGLTRNGSSSTSREQDPQVFVLAATNMPWELDMAMLRRLEKRIMVPLPGLEARRAMLSQLLKGRAAAEVDLDQIATATEGYSGSDVAVIAKEAAMRPLRRLIALLEPTVDSASSRRTALGETPAMAEPAPVAGASSSTLELGPITAADLAAALAVTKSSAQAYEAQYQEFSLKYGQTL